jgi:predicted permease
VVSKFSLPGIGGSHLLPFYMEIPQKASMGDNMKFDIVLNQVIILFIIMITGIAAAKAGIISDGVSKKLSELLLYVTNPMMVLGSFFFEYSREKLFDGLLVFVIGSIFFILTIILSKIIFSRHDEKKRPVLRFAMVFSNCGFIGLPMMKALFGNDGVFYGSFYVIAFNIFVWTFGITMFNNGKGANGAKGAVKTLKEALLNPAVIAVYVGLVIFILKIPIPGAVKEAVAHMGNITLPLSMLIIGSLISTAKFKTLFNDIKVYYVSFIRLIAVPLLAYFMMSFAGLSRMLVSIVVTALAMPVAAYTTIFADMFDRDAVFASKAVTFSTMFSILTAPLIVSLL